MAWSFNCSEWNNANDPPNNGMDDAFDVTNNDTGTAYLVESGASGSGTNDYTVTGQIQLRITTTESVSSTGTSGCDWTIQVSQP